MSVATLTHTCPCCGRKTNIYQRQLSEAHVYFLVEICEQFFNRKESIHYNEIQQRVKDNWGKNCTDYSILKNWFLLKPDEDKNGFFKPTKAAFHFLASRTDIPRYHYINDEFSQECIMVHQILDNPPKPNWIKVL